MRIASAEVVPYALPFREPYVTARGTLERREMALLRLLTDEGIEGLGEAVPLTLRGGAGLRDVVESLGRAAGALVGSDVSDEFLTPVVRNARERLPAPARAAIEMALLDLTARSLGVPAWQALGAPASRPVPVNATLAAADPPFVAAAAERWASIGFTTLKLKVGMPGDVAQVAAVREALGPGARIRVDANGAWGPAEAVTKLGAMERHGLELAEQPAPDLQDLRVVNGQTAIPIAADESIASPEEAVRAMELAACDLATAKLSKVGGIASALDIASRMPVYLSSALDGPVGIAAAGHAALALGDRDAGIAHGLATQLLFAESIAARESRIADGLLHLPEGPGLGVELDDGALARHRL